MFVCELIFVRMASSQGLSISGTTTVAILQSGGNISSQVSVTCCTELSQIGNSFWVVVLFKGFETVFHLAKHVLNPLLTMLSQFTLCFRFLEN